MKTITVAAVQMDALFAQREHNLAKAEGYIQTAALQGAELILLPEMLPYGYGLNNAVWDGAEPLHGPSVSWLCAQAKKYHAYIGFSFLETTGEDFYNTFVLAEPSGEIAGVVRKSPAASVEAYFYTHGNNSHVIETELGRIGINICYEVLLHERVNELYEGNIDLYLQCSASGRPKPFIPGDVARLENALRNARAIHYEALGVPIVLANRVGKLEGELPKPMGYLRSSFTGGSYISNVDGKVLKSLESEEGVIVAAVTLDPHYKSTTPPKRYGKSSGEYWAIPMPWYSFLYPWSQKLGEKVYAKSEERRLRVRQQYEKYTV